MTADNKKTKKPQIKWTRTVPLRRPDYIKSSVFAERGEMGFTPSYDVSTKVFESVSTFGNTLLHTS